MENEKVVSDEVKDNLLNPATWLRLVYMVFYFVVFNVVEILIAAVVLFQVIMTLFTGSRNQRAMDFGAQLGMYAYQILRYLTYNTDEAPFPFSEWPSGNAAPQVTTRPTGDTGGDDQSIP